MHQSRNDGTPPKPRKGGASEAEERGDDRTGFESLLSDLSSTFARIAPNEVDAEIDRKLRHICTFMQADRCALAEICRYDGTFHITHSWACQGVQRVPTSYETAHFPWIFAELLAGRTVRLPHLGALPPQAETDLEHFRALGTQSHVSVPLLVGGKTVGALEIASVRARRNWHEGPVQRLQMIGAVFANALACKYAGLQIEELLSFEKLISTISAAFINLPAPRIDQQITEMLRLIVEFLGLDRAVMFEFSPDRRRFHVTHTYTPIGSGPATDMTIDQFPWYVEQLLRGETIAIERLDELPAEAMNERALLNKYGIRSHLTIPLTLGGEILGAMGFGALRAEKRWSGALRQRLHLIGQVFASLLLRKRAEAEREGLLRFETWLSDLSAALINLPSVEIEREIERGLQQIVELLGLDRGSLMQFSDDGSQLVVTHAHATDGVQPLPLGTLNHRIPWAATRYRRGDVVVFEHLPEDLPAKAVAEKEFCRREGLKSLLGIPLNARGSTIGALALASIRTYRTWPAELVQRLRLAGEIFANALMRKRTEESLEKSEQQMRLMTDTLPMLIAYIDTERRYRFNNSAYEQWFGIPRERIQGRTMEDVLGPEAYEALKHYVDQALAGERVHFETEVQYREGLPRQVNGTYVPHADEAGNIQGFYVLIQDISERKHAEAETARLREKLAYMARVATMGELAASLAHEINQPLAGILSNAQAAAHLLKQKPPDLQEIHDTLNDIIADDKRAGEVIRRLRNMFKKGATQHEPLNINELIRQVAGFVRSDAQAKKIALALDLESGLPDIAGDQIQLQQVVLNLTLNGFEAMSETELRQRRLLIRTSRPEPATVEVSVSDTGTGLEEDIRAHMFEPFFTTKTHGLGMGLAISRSIVEAHGGTIRAAANSGRGITVHFTLPVHGKTLD